MSEPHAHVSDLTWDRLLAGELAGEAKAEALAAADACATCEARYAELRREQAAFARPFAASESSQSVGSLRPSRWWLAAPALVVAAAAIVLVMWPRSPAEPGAGERLKGGEGPELLVEAGPREFLKAVATGDFVTPGDFVQAGYTATRDGFGAVLGRDGTGASSVYVPSSGDAMVALPAGTRRSFPESTELDRVLGKEIIVVVWCETARPLAPLVAELRAHGDLPELDGCWHRRVILTKGRTFE